MIESYGEFKIGDRIKTFSPGGEAIEGVIKSFSDESGYTHVWLQLFYPNNVIGKGIRNISQIEKRK